MQISAIKNYNFNNCRTNFNGTEKINTVIQDNLWKVTKLTVGGLHGLHMRPSQIIVKNAMEGIDILRQQGIKGKNIEDVFIINQKGDKANCSSILSLLKNAFTTGTPVTLKTHKEFPNAQYKKIAETILDPDKIE